MSILGISNSRIKKINGVEVFTNGIEAETASYVSLQPKLTTSQLLAVNANIRLIKYGSGVTLSSLTAKFSTVDPTFVTQISQDLRWLAILNATVPITATWNDGTNTLAMYPVAAGTGETYAASVIEGDDNNGNMETGDPPTGWTTGIARGELSRTTDKHSGSYAALFTRNATGSNGYFVAASQAAIGVGKLAYHEVYLKCGTASSVKFMGVSTNYGVELTFGTVTAGTYTKVSGYGTVAATGARISVTVTGSNTQTGYADDIVVKAVTAPSASGFTASDLVGASFLPNAATFTLNIVRR
jgi:hypothetical protein